MAMCRNCCNLSPRRRPSDGMAASERPADGHVLARPRFWQVSPLKQPSKRSRPDHFQLRRFALQTIRPAVSRKKCSFSTRFLPGDAGRSAFYPFQSKNTLLPCHKILHPSRRIRHQRHTLSKTSYPGGLHAHPQTTSDSGCRSYSAYGNLLFGERAHAPQIPYLQDMASYYHQARRNTL